MRSLLMRYALLLLALLGSNAVLLQPALATVRISVDLASQSMQVDGDTGSYAFPISSARAGFSTPRGNYKPQRLVRMYHSKKYHNSPMPYSIFFRGGYAIHATGAVSQLGRPASHGCIRLSLANAATLYAMVQAEGARISISGTPPAGRSLVAGHRHHKQTQIAARHHHTKRSLIAAAHPHRHAVPALAYAPQYKPGSFGHWLKTLPLR